MWYPRRSVRNALKGVTVIIEITLSIQKSAEAIVVVSFSEELNQ